MKVVKKEIEVSYKGHNYIDLNTLIASQLHFLTAINEIKRELYPQAPMSVKIAAFKEGSFVVQLIIESSFIHDLFNTDNVKHLAEIVGGFATIVKLYQELKGKKATDVTESDGKVDVKIDGDGNEVNVDKKIFNIYKNNITINVAIQKNFELLQEDEDIEGIVIKESGKKKPILSVPREEFENLSRPNPYLDREQSEEIRHQETLFIRKPNLFPEKDKVWVWEFIHKGRMIKAKILDNDFRMRINEGLKVGQGDRIIADLKIFFRFDERFMTYIENGRYEIISIHDIKNRDEQFKLDFGPRTPKNPT